MRQARVKPSDRDVFYHVYNRVSGTSLDLPFGEEEKCRFLVILNRLLELYVVEVIGFAVMGNHYHLILFAPMDVPSEELTCARYAAYYRGKRTLEPGTPACRRMAQRLRDISGLMHDLQHQFTGWFNRTRPVRRRGSLWAGRFKHTILEAGLAVWDCWKYVELNPVRAGLVADPADYRYGSFGQWAALGRHPFAETLTRRLMPRLRDLLGVQHPDELWASLRREFPVVTAPLAATVGEVLPFSTTGAQRVRYWTDGLIIGSRAFILQLMTPVCGAGRVARRQLTPAVEARREDQRLVCYKRLRALPS